MKIVACIKYSFDTAEIKVDPQTKELRLANVPQRVGTIDKHVLEAAASLNEAHGGSVHALSFGPTSAKDSFREAMAMGLDDLTLIEDPFEGQGGPAVTATVLAAAIKKLGAVDLIICGEVSDDGFTYQVPLRLAEQLKLPQLAYVRTFSVEEGQITADRDLDDGMQTVQSPLPAVISVTEDTNTPRRPTLKDALMAKKKPIHVWQIESDLDLSQEKLSQKGALDRVQTEGIVIDRKQQLLQGDDPAELANRLVDLLLADNVIKGGA